MLQLALEQNNNIILIKRNASCATIVPLGHPFPLSVFPLRIWKGQKYFFNDTYMDAIPDEIPMLIWDFQSLGQPKLLSPDKHQV